MAMPVYVVTSATPPSTGEQGARVWWIDTTTGTLKRWNGTAWEDLLVGSGEGGGGPHTHPISDIVDLQDDLDALAAAITGKADGVHTHAQSDITGLVAALAAKADSVHTHAQSDITGLVAALAAKQASSEKGVANGYAGLDANGRVPLAQLNDPWSYVQVNGGADFTTSSATAVDATGLAFTPVADTMYEFEATLMIRTATATVNPRVGLAWPTGLTDGVASIAESQSATAQLLAHGNINAALLIAVGGLPNTTQSWPVSVYGILRAGATPSGNLRIQLASETAGTTVRIVARSFLKFRTLPF